MNKTQATTIEKLRDTIVRLKSTSDPDQHEFKIFNVKDHDHFVSLVAEYGRKEDEGTYASLLCRYHYHFFIGKRGGVKLVSFSSGLKSATPKGIKGVFNSVNYYPSN